MSTNSDRLREFFNSDVTDAAADELDELEQKLAASEARVGVLELAADADRGQIARMQDAMADIIEDLNERIANGERFNPGTLRAILRGEATLAALSQPGKGE